MSKMKDIQALIVLLHERGLTNEGVVRGHVKLYLEELYPDATINFNELEYDYEVLPSVDDQSLRCVTYYGNLYTFVLFCGIAVPYYNWIDDDKFETEKELYEKKIDPVSKVVMFACYNKISAKYTYMGMTKSPKETR